MVEGGRTPVLSFEELQAIGYGLAIFPATAFLAAAKAYEHVYTALKQTRSSASVHDALYDFPAFSKLMGFDWVTAFDQAHAKPDSKA
jgi:2-methylisocitrate lyase-like PEP mutase family enzyme